MADTDIKPLVSPWVPEQDVRRQKVLGKGVEEAGEYTSAVARCFIQGIDESEPTTGKPNKRWLEEELADVVATSQHLVETFDLDVDFIRQRAEKKYAQLATWFSMEVERVTGSINAVRYEKLKAAVRPFTHDGDTYWQLPLLQGFRPDVDFDVVLDASGLGE